MIDYCTVVLSSAQLAAASARDANASHRARLARGVYRRESGAIDSSPSRSRTANISGVQCTCSPSRMWTLEAMRVSRTINLSGEDEIEYLCYFFEKKMLSSHCPSVYLFKASLVVHFVVFAFNLSHSLYSLINQRFKALVVSTEWAGGRFKG